MTKKKTQTEPYLKIPYHILNLTGIGLPEKVLLAHIYSFGEKGCWQSNQTLAEIFMVSPATISRWLRRIRKFCYIKNPKGYYRTIWIKSLFNAKVPKDEHGPAKNCASDLVKSANQLAQNCAITNNNTIINTTKDTIASPSPLPARGQAPAPLQHRKAYAASIFNKTIANFGRTKADFKPMSQAEFEKRRAAQIKALLGK